MIRWFRGLAAVPDIECAGDRRLRRMSLLGHDAVPTLHSYTVDGKCHQSLMWPMSDGATSASPAARHAMPFSSSPGIPIQAQLQRLHEVLALPGTTSDYHVAIQRCIDELWKRRHQEPDVLPEVERLCWLDIGLVEARPETITDERGGKPTYFRVLAFGYLIQLYEQEGFLVEALEVAQRAARFDQGKATDQLRERLAQVDAEG